jgi:hypothetical protein
MSVQSWDGRPFRRPDVYSEGTGYAVWYGPGGREGENATEVETSGSGFDVTEYQYIGGPEEHFLQTRTWVDVDELTEAQRVRGQRLPRTEEEWLRLAAGYGVARLFEYGGEEEMVDSLP